ncbi:hypothetical protein TbgDal_VIII5230 [Trypanosoma brucei gambiense DAL972]|uniref:Uncharacterized protein n=1 Tax=Trypanosoma brucei gambiense (strain MHOM/CI/86/DAL972) TaxID=679716 RepID=C9ZVZ4_TRYB9|nr:hypothetical protein TbgDal_VIII5230 [Trypanosoma brucei gambiense DAL972]CBH13582.1 hypothetical protein TbgDal_VIII5230 [Trypanosoma brucei gambiense DAL972]|eukprot:XP_011775859.1 hypothetical protein TbgDal_VIII5230 [Trypanosoma brucei gambiense DAL972]
MGKGKFDPFNSLFGIRFSIFCYLFSSTILRTFSLNVHMRVKYFPLFHPLPSSTATTVSVLWRSHFAGFLSLFCFFLNILCKVCRNTSGCFSCFAIVSLFLREISLVVSLPYCMLPFGATLTTAFDAGVFFLFSSPRCMSCGSGGVAAALQCKSSVAMLNT